MKRLTDLFLLAFFYYICLNLKLLKMGKTKEEFRILEHKDHYTIQQKSIEDVWVYWLGVPVYIKETKERWRDVLVFKDGRTQILILKTKPDCLQWIDDFYKYPIYHNV